MDELKVLLGRFESRAEYHKKASDENGNPHDEAKWITYLEVMSDVRELINEAQKSVASNDAGMLEIPEIKFPMISWDLIPDKFKDDFNPFYRAAKNIILSTYTIKGSVSNLDWIYEVNLYPQVGVDSEQAKRAVNLFLLANDHWHVLPDKSGTQLNPHNICYLAYMLSEWFEFPRMMRGM